MGDSMFVKEMPTLAILVQLDIDAVETDLDVVVTYRTGDEVFAVTEVYIPQMYQILVDYALFLYAEHRPVISFENEVYIATLG